MSHSEQLRAKLSLVLPPLRAAQQSFLNHPRISRLYPEYLFTMHCMIRASVPLMETAVQRCRLRADEDPLAASIIPYLEEHILEEQHDHWPLEDLEVLGQQRADLLARIPSPTVAALVGAQYYWINHYHPVALFGYMEVLEGYPAAAEVIDTLVAGTGYPRAAFRSLENHARADIGHNRDRHALLDRLPLRPQHIALLGVTAMTAAHALSGVFSELVDLEPKSLAG